MAITLSAEQERLVDQAMQAGGYRNSDDVIARALEVLRADDGFLHEQRAAIDAKIERALEQFERGEFLSAKDSRADMAERKAVWLRDQQR